MASLASRRSFAGGGHRAADRGCGGDSAASSDERAAAPIADGGHELAGIGDADDRVFTLDGLLVPRECVAAACPAIVGCSSAIRIAAALVDDGLRPETRGFDTQAIAPRRIVQNLAGGHDRLGGTDLAAASADPAVHVRRAGVPSTIGFETCVLRMRGIEFGDARVAASATSTASPGIACAKRERGE